MNLKKVKIGLWASLLLCSLVACSEEAEVSKQVVSISTPTLGASNNTTVQTGPVVNVCSWGEYIDLNLMEQFTQETGIAVNYQTAESNEALYELLGRTTMKFDVVIPSDYMISQMIEEGMLAPLNFENIPNAQLIGETFQHQPYDPENLYTVPYTWGTLGMIYNTTHIQEDILSWDAMFNPAYRDSVLMIRNPRDAFAIALMHLGYSVNTTNPQEITQAQQLILQALEQGVYQNFVMDEVFPLMEEEIASLATYYAGDYLIMAETNENLAFILPETGSNWFIDAMCILEVGENKEEAEAWINFMSSTASSLANMDYIGYASPNTEALELYPNYYENLYQQPLNMELYEIMAPPLQVLERCEGYLMLPVETRDLYEELWIGLTS